MKDPELDILIEELETRGDMPAADFDGVLHALQFLLPGGVPEHVSVDRMLTTDGALIVADGAYPNWAIQIHGRANDKDGHWRCTLRENALRDSDEVMGVGRSPVLAQALLAAVLRLSMARKKDD